MKIHPKQDNTILEVQRFLKEDLLYKCKTTHQQNEGPFRIRTTSYKKMKECERQ